MTLTQLEYIIAVDTHRHFGLAAQKSFVTQPTLSMQIQKLENELNVKIFDRSNFPIRPTDLGVAIIEQAREAVKEANRVKEIIYDKQENMGGIMRLGIIPTVAPYLLPLFIGNFIKKYPGVTLHVEELQTEQILRKLYDETIDAGILVTPTEEKGLIEIPLYYEQFIVYTSPGHKLAKEDKINPIDLDTTDIWLLNQGHCFRNQMLRLCQNKSTNAGTGNFDFESGSLETLRKLVENESGFTLLPELAIRDFNPYQLSMVKQFEPPVPVREISIISRRNYLKKKLIDTLQNEITSHLPPELLKKNNKEIIGWR